MDRTDPTDHVQSVNERIANKMYVCTIHTDRERATNIRTIVQYAVNHTDGEGACTIVHELDLYEP